MVLSSTPADSDNFQAQLRAYVNAVLACARHELQPWFNLEALGLSDVALATFYFLYKAIDGNESKPAGVLADDYLLILPDAALAEEAVQGALLGALLGKYRANYMASDSRPQPYEVGDVLLKARKDGDFQWYQVDAIDAEGNMRRRVEAFRRANAKGEAPGYTEPLRNAMRLLSMRQARTFELGLSYPSKELRDNLVTAIGQIRRYLGDVELVSRYRHRMGVVCASDTTRFVAETHPMPLRDWSTQHNPRMLLPLEPMAETARAYHYLVQNVFNRRDAYNQVEELLVFDTRQYCDGNGHFADLLQGRPQGYYRNLVLVGSRPPYTPAGQEPHPFRRWEWTPEELAVLLGQTLRYPVVTCVADEALRQQHEEALLTWQILTEQHPGLDLQALPRLLPLLYGLVLPPAAEADEINRQIAGLRQWAEQLLLRPNEYTRQDVFSQALIYDAGQRAALQAQITQPLTELARVLAAHNGKLAWLRAQLTAQPANAPLVLLLPRREAACAQAVLQATLPPAEYSRLRVVDGSRLPQLLQDPTLNDAQAVWVVPSLRLGHRRYPELSAYRQLLLARARVHLLAYAGLDEARYTQLATLHHRLLAQALAHPDRQWFVGTQLVAPAVAVMGAATGNHATEHTNSSTESVPASSEFEQLNAVFGEPGSGQLPPPNDAAANSGDEESEDEPGAVRRGQQCELLFTDHTTCRVAYSRVVDVLLPTPTGPLLGQRRPDTLLAGDVVLTLDTDRGRLLPYLRRQEPAKYQAVAAASECWLNVLRQLYREKCRHQPDILHRQLTNHGLRLRLVTLQRWLETGTNTRFPRRKGNLKAIAELETQWLGASARLLPQLPHILAQRRLYNAAVRRVTRSSQFLLFEACLSNDAQLARQALGAELVELLLPCVQTRTLERLRLL